MNKILLLTSVLFLACGLKAEKPVASEPKPMSTSKKTEFELRITSIRAKYSATSNGSTHSSHDKVTTYNYSPTAEESESLLNNGKVNKKASLREYLTALKNSDQKFLDDLEFKPPKPKNTGTEERPTPTEGGMNHDTTITISGPGWSINPRNFKFVVESEAVKMAQEKGKKTVLTGEQVDMPEPRIRGERD